MDKYKTIMLVLAFANTLNAVAYESISMARQAPRITMDSGEHMLSSSEIAESPCTNLVRGIVGRMPDVVMASEEVSRSDDFGNIYRYRIVRPIEDGGKIYEAQLILVAWSTDCEAVELATYPTFQLPRP
jgi:hypothetical protein